MGGIPSELAFDPAELPYDERQRVLNMEISLQSLARKIKKGQIKNVVALVGAGISVAAGIPDFRSEDTGLYANLAQYNLPYPEAVFEIDYFRDNPRPFYRLARELYPGAFSPTKTHYFLRLLEQKGILRRIYTQNIDTLERMAGISPDKLVEAHGSFANASCTECYKAYTQEWLAEKIFPMGRDSYHRDNTTAQTLAAKTAEPVEDGQDEIIIPFCEEPACDGIVKPNITFFGEALPTRFHDLSQEDMRVCDLLVVIGTSLKVHPVCELPDQVPDLCPRLLINREAVNLYEPVENLNGLSMEHLERLYEAGAISGNPKGFRFTEEDNYRDIFVEGDADQGIQEFADLLGWTKELEQLLTTRRSALDLESSVVTHTRLSTTDLDSDLIDTEKMVHVRPLQPDPDSLLLMPSECLALEQSTLHIENIETSTIAVATSQSELEKESSKHADTSETIKPRPASSNESIDSTSESIDTQSKRFDVLNIDDHNHVQDDKQSNDHRTDLAETKTDTDSEIEWRIAQLNAVRQAGENLSEEQLTDVTRMMRKAGLNILELAEADLEEPEKS